MRNIILKIISTKKYQILCECKKKLREGEENGDKMNCNDYFYIKNRTIDEIMRLEIQSHKACQ